MIILDKIREKERKKIRKEILEILAIRYQSVSNPNEQRCIEDIAESFGIRAEEVKFFAETFRYASVIFYKKIF